MEQFFDCNIPEDGNGTGEVLAIESAEQQEAFKMDKDLGVFEFISKKDFSTVNQGPSAAAGQPAEEQKQESNFDFGGNSKPAEGGQGFSADQFFNFDAVPASDDK